MGKKTWAEHRPALGDENLQDQLPKFTSEHRDAINTTIALHDGRAMYAVVGQVCGWSLSIPWSSRLDLDLP